MMNHVATILYIAFHAYEHRVRCASFTPLGNIAVSRPRCTCCCIRRDGTLNCIIIKNRAPDGGAAAAAPEGGALAGPSASPPLPVVGAGNPVAVPCLAR
jgi:hypothetical protein